MASIVTRKDRPGKLCVYYRDSDGRRRGKFFPTTQRREAKRFAARMDATAGTATQTIGLETAIVYYIEDRALSGIATATIERYKCVLLKLADELGPQTPLHRITNQMLNDWKIRRLKERQTSTVRNDIKALGAFLNWSIARRWLTDSPLKGIKPPERKEIIKPFLMPERMDALIALAAAHPRREFHLLTVLACDAGLRRNEAIGLPWSHVDFERRLLLIVGKSKKPRSVPMSPLVESALLDWGQTGPMVFPPVYKTANTRSPHLAKEYNAWLASLDLGIHSIKALRDSFATRLLIRGAPGRVAADLLGHSDERTTRIYQTVVLDHARRFVAPDTPPANQPPKSETPRFAASRTETTPAPSAAPPAPSAQAAQRRTHPKPTPADAPK